MTETIESVQQQISKLINFAEINANAYDEWEQFSELLLREMGFIIIQPPARGADGGKDMVVIRANIKYIVSCKHYANSGRAVGVEDETNILDRIKASGAQGFIGVYSSGATQALIERLEGLKRHGEIVAYQILQSHDIEQFLLQRGCSMLVRRYFPESYSRSKIAARVYQNHIPLQCSVCGQDLLACGQGWIMWADELINGVTHILDIGCACKGACISRLEATLYDKYKDRDVSVLSEEIHWCVNPAGFIWRLSRIMNGIRTGQCIYTNEAWEAETEINLALAQCSMRDATDEDRQMINILMNMG